MKSRRTLEDYITYIGLEIISTLEKKSTLSKLSQIVVKSMEAKGKHIIVCVTAVVFFSFEGNKSFKI